MADETPLAKRIYDTAHITGDFTLRSGAKSTEYFDKYLFEADPDLLKHIALAMVKLVPPEKLRHAHHWLILHGRAICKAPTPLCERCPVNAICPSEPIVAKTLQKKARAKTRTSLAALKQKQFAKKKSASKKRAPKAK